MQPHLATERRELAHVVGDLDPVAGVEAQHVVAAQRLQFQLGGRHHARHAAAHARILARPFERGGAAGRGRAGVVDLHAVGLILQPSIAAAGRQLARVFLARHVEGVGGQPPGRGRSERRPAGHVFIGRAAIGAARIGRQHAYLPHGLLARTGFHPDGGLNQIGAFEVRDFAFPHIQIHEMPAGRGQRGRARQVRLRAVSNRVSEVGLGHQRIEEFLRRIGGHRAVVLGKQAVHVEPPLADGKRPRHRGDLECVGRGR